MSFLSPFLASYLALAFLTSAAVVCPAYLVILGIILKATIKQKLSVLLNSEDPDQNAPAGAALSGSTLFASMLTLIKVSKYMHQMT